MTAFGKLNKSMGRILQMRLVRHSDLYAWQINPTHERSYRPNRVPAEAKKYLHPANPRLRELKESYEAFDNRVNAPVVWFEGKLEKDELIYFRGHNPFTNQISGLNYNELSYALAYYALKSSNAADLLGKIREDGFFGAYTFDIDHRQVSRDLLDSVGEINFIRRHLDLSNTTNILDIGAGYGRLAHRLTEVTNENVRVFTTDAVAVSTFICEFYLKFRKAERAESIPLTEVDNLFKSRKIDLATNIHSFSECSISSIDWWLERLASHRVKYLLIIPNRTNAAGQCVTNAGENIEEILEHHGYRIHVREPRYLDPAVQRYAVDPCFMNLFRLGE